MYQTFALVRWPLQAVGAGETARGARLVRCVRAPLRRSPAPRRCGRPRRGPRRADGEIGWRPGPQRRARSAQRFRVVSAPAEHAQDRGAAPSTPGSRRAARYSAIASSQPARSSSSVSARSRRRSALPLAPQRRSRDERAEDQAEHHTAAAHVRSRRRRRSIDRCPDPLLRVAVIVSTVKP
jgi:hypothetical protein